MDNDQAEQIKKLQEQILETIYNQPDCCITLAQLPSCIQERFGAIPDLPSLGFPKLKNFLQTLQDHIIIQEINKNHIKVKLKNKFKYLLQIKLKKDYHKLSRNTQ